MVTTRSAQIAAIVLAAGGSTRMGLPKLLLPFRGQPMVRQVTEAVCSAGLTQVIVVVGGHAERVIEALDGLPVEVVTNQAWRSGLSSSICAGLSSVRPDIEAALIVLADQPMVTRSVIRALVEAYLETGAPVIAPVHQGRRGHPVLFDGILFGELQALTGDQGARDLIARQGDAVQLVQVDDMGVVLDIDTIQDYQRATGIGQRHE